MNITNPSVNIGIGVIITNDKGEVLIGKRIGKHAPKYSIVGGKPEVGETFEQTAIREVKEETNLDIINPKVIAITNNLETYKEEGYHSVSVILLAEKYTGELQLMEPSKCERWIWCNPNKLLQPHYDASAQGIKCWLEKKYYIEH